MHPSAHHDTFTRDNLPRQETWPEFLNLEQLGYGAKLNAAVELVDRTIANGRGDHPALICDDDTWSYSQLAANINRIANVLVDEYGFQPGNRVLIRSPNNPMMVAIYFAVLKAGGVVVATMPLLRPKELVFIIDKARVGLGFCDVRLTDDLERARETANRLPKMGVFGGDGAQDLTRLMANASPKFESCPTASDDVCLIGFTSGTTGEPKGTMHFHRDLMATCDSYSKLVLRPRAEDRFIGSPPLAFTFGLGGLILFPFHAGATAILVERAMPENLLGAIERHRASVCFTAPTAYRAMLAKLNDFDISSLRTGVSAGETLPKSTWEEWHAATGIELLDGLGATEMLHIFIGSSQHEIRAGATGKPVPHYEARIVAEDGSPLPDGEVGLLAVRGPTGCRYLDDPRQREYVRDGWNITGDAYLKDTDGYFWFQARADDMIISAGYNIAGPEVEEALLAHADVADCGVVGAPDAQRGQIVTAYIVARAGAATDAAAVKALQDHVKAEISPYKYPRAIRFVDQLPRTDTGKLQRFVLRQRAHKEITP